MGLIEEDPNGHGSSASGSEEDENEVEGYENNECLEEVIKELTQLVTMFFNEKFEVAVMTSLKKSSSHMVHAFGTALFKGLHAISFEDDKSLIEDALQCFNHAKSYTNYFRKKISSSDGHLQESIISMDEEEAFAELLYANCFLFAGLVSLMGDKSFYGAVNTAAHANHGHESLMKCMMVLQTKSDWTSELLRMNFEAATRFGLGIVGMVTSLLPTEMKTQFNLQSDQKLAIDMIKQATKFTDSFIYYPSSMILVTIEGLLQFIYEVGENDPEFFEVNQQIWNEKTSNSRFIQLWSGIWKQVSGHVEESMELYQGLIEGAASLPPLFYHVALRGTVHCCIMKRDWNEGLKGLKILQFWRGSPSEFMYLRAVFMSMKMLDEGDRISEKERLKMYQEMSESFKRIPDVHRDVGRKMVYHESIIFANSERFKDDPSQMFVPILDMCYIWNIYAMMNGNKSLLNGYLDMIDGYINKYQLKKDQKSRKNLDNFAYLTFSRGTVLRHLGSLDQATKCFNDVLSCKKRISVHKKHLLPQTCFELGMVQRKLGKLSEAKHWFKKARDDYKGYVTYYMIHHRVESMLTQLNVKKNGPTAQLPSTVTTKVPSSVPSMATKTMKTGVIVDGDGIAITGMAGRYPESSNVHEFWSNLLSGKEMYKESNGRWPAGYMDTPRKVGMIPGIEKFDAEFFGISDSIADEMDPQFRLLNEVVYEAVLDAGLDPVDMRNDDRTGVYIGYFQHPTDAARNEVAVNEDNYFRQEDFASVSKTFGFKGPVMTSDSACASSNSALNEAFYAIKCGLIDTAIVCGAGVIIRPQAANYFKKLKMTNVEGNSYCLDSRANGYVRSETVSAIILQRKSVAKRCYAILVNVKSNAVGYKEEGITYPGMEAQLKLIQESYDEVNIDPKVVQYIEAHMTSTQAGDLVECQAMESAFCPDDRKDPLLIGCIKSNMGHAEGASGMAAITKTCLIFQRKLIPANINYENPNPKIDGLLNGKLKPVTQLTTFEGGYVSINNFGFGGCNVHAILKSMDNVNGGNKDVHNLSGYNNIDRLILFKARNESSFKYFQEIIEREPDQITTEFLAMVNNVAFLKEEHEQSGNGCLNKLPVRGYFIIDGHNKKILECDWKECQSIDCSSDFDDTKNQIESIKNVQSRNLFLSNTLLTKLGKCYMNHPESELFIAMNILYPEVSFPVSRTTSSISPLIKWNHEKDRKVFKVPNYSTRSAQRDLIRLEYVGHHSHLKGHVIDGRVIVPATQYLQSVWQSMAKEKIWCTSDAFLKTGIKFWNVKFHQATIVNDVMNDVVMTINADTFTGYFEVVRDDVYIVTGYAALTYDEPCPRAQKVMDMNSLIVEEDGKREVLKKEDFYKELRIRGYDYEDKFQGVEECFVDGSGGKISFLQNWTSFADAVLQVSLIDDPSRNLVVPTGIEMLQVDPSQFRHIPTLEKEYPVDDENVDQNQQIVEVFNVQIKKETKEIFSDGGLYIKSMAATPIVRKKINPIISKYIFRPFKECFDETINFKQRLEYEEECIKLVDSMAGHKKRNNKNIQTLVMESDGHESTDLVGENRGLISKLKEYKKNCAIKNGFKDGNMNQIKGCPSIVEFLRMSKSEDGLFNDSLLDIPLQKEESTSHQLQLIGEINFFSKTQIVEINTSSRTCVENNLRDLSSLIGSVKTYDYVDRQSIKQQIEKDGQTNGLNPIDKLMKTSITTNCKLIVVQHPSLGFSFLDSVPEMRKRIQTFKQGIKSVHEHASNDTFAMVMFRTEEMDIESSIMSVSSCPSHDDELFPSSEEMEQLMASIGWTIISTKLIGSYVSILAKKVDVKLLNEVTKLEVDNFRYDWVDDLVDKAYNSADIVDGNKSGHEKTIFMITRGPGLTGINGFIRCVHREDKRFRAIHIDESKRSSFDTILATCIKYGLLCTYYRNGMYGSYMAIDGTIANDGHNVDGNPMSAPIEDESNEIVTTNCLDVATKGDLSSLKYYKIKLPINGNDGTRIVDVHYSALNFKDVMVATGRVPVSAYPFGYVAGGDLGMEFSGMDTISGNKLMGFVANDAIAEKIRINPSDLVFDVPNHMSLEEAATIPVVYSTVYYALIMRGKLLPGESILIHAGSGGVGQAAISVCQSMGCEIFTTVGTAEKRQFIKSQFNISDDHIFNSRSVSFADDLLIATNGRGVDMVLNSLSEEKLQAGLNCLADGGRFIEIGKYDMVNNSPFDPSLLTRNQSFQSVCLAFFMHKMGHWTGPGMCPEEVQLRQLMDKGLKDGIVKPLQRTIFGMDQPEEAFRFMATGKHIGKVLMDMKGKDECIKSGNLDIKPRVTFDGHKSYLIVGGLGGMGLEMCHWLVAKGARNIIVTSRSGIKTSFQKFCMDRLKRDFDCNVQVSNLDIANYEEAEKLLKFCDQIGPLAGIFHIAMVLSEATLMNQSTKSYEACCPIKVQGGHNLDLITRKSYPNLDHFVFYSSIASTFGNVGQSNYGLANCFLDDLCAKRRADGYSGLTIAWGLVGDVGWAADNMGDVTSLGAVGIQRINSCNEVLDQILYSNHPNMVSFVPAVGAENVAKSTNIAEIVYNILGVKDPSKLDPKTTLGDLGLDSLMAVELKQVLEKETGTNYTVKEIRSTTVQEIDEIFTESKS